MWNQPAVNKRRRELASENFSKSQFPPLPVSEEKYVTLRSKIMRDVLLARYKYLDWLRLWRVRWCNIIGLKPFSEYVKRLCSYQLCWIVKWAPLRGGTWKKQYFHIKSMPKSVMIAREGCREKENLFLFPHSQPRPKKLKNAQ